MTKMPDICDYEGSQYRTDFWEGQGRNYEDMVERLVLQKLLPNKGKRLLEIGAAYGRLTPEYQGFDTVVLLDYSFSQLQYARQQLGDDGYIYVAANAYQLPFQSGTFDGATIIRVIHHMEDASAVLAQVRRVMIEGGTFILEYANKRNLKAMIRYALKKQEWNPNTLEPVEFVRLNFDFHPQYIKQVLTESQFSLQAEIPVSFLRIGLLKNNLPANVLVNIDQLLQKSNWLVSHQHIHEKSSDWNLDE